MSKQRSAPGELERVRRFVNTRQIGRGTELLTDPAAMADWFVAEGLAPGGLRATRADLSRAIELREALRKVLAAHNVGESAPADPSRILDATAGRARLRLHFEDDGGASLVPDAAGVDGAFGRLLAIVHDAIAQGTWTRLKACRDHTCAWAFYDHTKNHSGAWCSMERCGNRAKARTHRERHTAPPAARGIAQTHPPAAQGDANPAGG
jgi:predicted RNA-binding Zn ribbon-like protein